MTEHPFELRTNVPARLDPDLLRNWPAGGPEIAIRYVPTASLKLPKRQLRKHSKKNIAQIGASIGRFGFVSPIQVDGKNRIIAGVGRWLAATAMELVTVPVVILDYLGPIERRLLALADNQLASLSCWDEDLLAIELGELTIDLDIDIEITGFSTVQVDNLLLGAAKQPPEVIELPDGDQPAVARLGDLFVLGDHRLLCGDARDERSYAVLLGTERARMVFSDSPFNVKIRGNVSGLGKVKHREFVVGSGEMSRPELIEFLTAIFRHLATYRRDGLRLALAILAAEEAKWAALLGESPSWRTNAIREVRHKTLQVAQTRVRTVLNRHSSKDSPAMAAELAAALEKAGL